jgi:hypothetical protein
MMTKKIRPAMGRFFLSICRDRSDRSAVLVRVDTKTVGIFFYLQVLIIGVLLSLDFKFDRSAILIRMDAGTVGIHMDAGAVGIHVYVPPRLGINDNPIFVVIPAYAHICVVLEGMAAG